MVVRVGCLLEQTAYVCGLRLTHRRGTPSRCKAGGLFTDHHGEMRPFTPPTNYELRPVAILSDWSFDVRGFLSSLLIRFHVLPWDHI